MRKLLFIHGWSDDGDAFNTMIHEVLQGGHHERYSVCLADFISLDDAVTFTDLVEAMQAAWIAHRLPMQGKSVSVITHSTGALVLRAWLRRYYPQGGSPISHALLLAPPNFGSYLAHKGRAFYGRVLKGIGNPKPFEVGEKLLMDLELASPFLWDLASFDVCSPSTSFHPRDILTTIAIGDRGYEGIASAANIPGSDGVVSLASAQLMAQRITVQYLDDQPAVTHTPSYAQVAFAIIPGVNHATILGTPHPAPEVVSLCIEALSIQKTAFTQYCQRLSAANALHIQRHPSLGFQQTISQVSNQYKQYVDDYYIDFAAHMHTSMVLSVHTHSQAPAYRSFTINSAHVQNTVACPSTVVDIGITGKPSLLMPKVCVGYKPYTRANGQALSLPLATWKQLCTPGGVLLLEWQIKRGYKSALFTLEEPDEVCMV